MNVLYNDIDENANATVRELIKHQHLPDGFIEERSIKLLTPEEVREYHQCHFFSGIGGWPYSLKLAGWPDEWPIWTASCPCQPFSVAGSRKGSDDPRHLWPDLFRLIKANRPPVIMGEQVAGKAGYDWFDGICIDLEGEGYATRAVDIPACAVNAPHIRNRLYWLAVANTFKARRRSNHQPSGAKAQKLCTPSLDDVADSDSIGQQSRGRVAQSTRQRGLSPSAHGGFWDNWIPVTSGIDGKTRRAEPSIPLLVAGLSGRVAQIRGYGNAIVPPLAAQVIMAFMDVMEIEK